MADRDLLKFKISTGLKNLIGKELITDELIAIFELVKNSYDAHATHVKLYFKNNKSSNAQIIIVDNGKGMDIEDIQEKWLFVAYSAKKDGSEDEQEKEDYRSKLKSLRGFAGAKGVGRFSCDRLGNKLNLITIKDKNNALIENINVKWEEFEKNNKAEFAEIGVKHKVLEKIEYDIPHGTILEITGLRDKWERDKLIKLKNSLEKLINPNQQTDSFSIELIADDEINDDKKAPEYSKINGFIKNSIFEVLKIKTTKINVLVENKTITTTLEDRGKIIYKTIEINPYVIEDISFELFYLNHAAKTNFTKLMGIRPKSYGSIFMYKNGFRIYPFGEEGEDPLKLDMRKNQGHNRFLGTRELIGRIEITDFRDNFIETTSRDGGFIKNNFYEDLTKCFYDKGLKRLEKYVVSIIRWGEPYKINSEDSNERNRALDPEDVKSEIIETIKKISLSKDIISVEYDPDFIEIIEERQQNSASRVISNLTVRALESTNDPELHKDLNRIGKKFNELLIERNEFEKESELSKEQLQQMSEDLNKTESQNLFLKSVASTNVKEIVSLQHHIDHGTVKIGNSLNGLKDAIKNDASKLTLMKFVEKISIENEKISTIARFVTKANFNTTSKTITRDIVQFINEYIENVYLHYEDLNINNTLLGIEIDNSKNIVFSYKFKPLEVIIIVDNLLSNSYKAGAKNVQIVWEKDTLDTLKMIYRDDGKGIESKLVDKIFHFGFTTTDGSGLGLFHVRQLLENMNGRISVNTNKAHGAEFILEVHNGTGI
ncbi:ATP-binding protein [Paenibacillus sp. GCM10023252]|uniref:ATP-binding protein n=1 Tax=Paenibacillus sp. GCM10023252 TaxID=3252649 RepID=UPI003613296F